LAKHEEYEERAESMLMPVMEEMGFELVDVEYVKEGGNWYLRAYVDKEGGITLNDCEKVNRIWSDLMDEDDFIPDAYILEVSSPGLGRMLKKDKHLARSLGEAVELKTYKPIEKCREFEGILKGYDRDSVTIEVEEKTGKKELVFARTDVASIRLALDF